MQKFISIEPMEPGTVHESTGLLHSDRGTLDTFDLPPLTKQSQSAQLESGERARSMDSTIEQLYQVRESDTMIFSPMTMTLSESGETLSNRSSSAADPLTQSLSGSEMGSGAGMLHSSTALGAGGVGLGGMANSSSAASTRTRDSKAAKEPKSVRK